MSFLARLEPRTRSADLAAGVAARLADPLWLLAQQLRIGELCGDDAGTPVLVRHTAQVRRLAGWHPREASPLPYNPDRAPLEAVVEARPTHWTTRLRVDVGRAMLRRLHEHGTDVDAAAVTAAFPLDQPGPAAVSGDPGVARLAALASGRVPDGEKLHRTLAAGLRRTPPRLDATGLADPASVLAAAVEWLAWCDALGLEQPAAADAWDAARHEYRFSVLAPSPADTLRLDADEHTGGALDWYSFDAHSTPNTDPAAPVRSQVSESLPVPAVFHGMPDPRWWTFEDGTFDLGRVDANPADLARLAVLEFALVFGNDFFVTPVRLDVGSVCRTTSLLVSDTFGLTTRIRPGAADGPGGKRTPHGAARWTMFTLSTTGGGVAEYFLLLPTAPQRLTSSPLEEVLLRRDEMANLAWAEERRYEGEAGVPIDRSEQIRREPATVADRRAATLRYVLGTTVPGNWFPLVPSTGVAGPRFTVSLMAHSDEPNPRPRGLLLSVGDVVEDEDIPREGKRLWREHALTRWTDGSTAAWGRLRASVGRGEGSSGLRFDVAERRDASE